jgi:hypothetical protein
VTTTCWLVGLDSTYTVMMEWEREDSRLSSWLPTRRCVMPRLITCSKQEQPACAIAGPACKSAAALSTGLLDTWFACTGLACMHAACSACMHAP